MVNLENIFYLLKKLNMSERIEIEEFFNIFAKGVSQLIINSLSDSVRIIWSRSGNSLCYDPSQKKFYYFYNGSNINLSNLNPTEFWHCAKHIMDWISGMTHKLEEIIKERDEIIKSYQNIKSDMIRLEKENKINLGLGFFKDESDNN